MTTAIWFITGFGGWLLVWRLWTLTPKPAPHCPTPRAVAVCLALSFVGFFVALAVVGAAVGFFIDWIDDDRPPQKTWWNTPFCDKSADR